MRTTYRMADCGIFIVEKVYCRGLDVKLKVDAHCLVFGNGSDIKESDVLQMMGRGSRAQGQGKGTFYMMGDPLSCSDGWRMVKSNSERQVDDGGKNLLVLFKVSKTFSLKNKADVINAYNKDNWQCLQYIFEHRNQKAVLALKNHAK